MVFPAYGVAVKGGAAGDHVPHEVGALLLEGPDDDCSNMFLLHRTLYDTENNRIEYKKQIQIRRLIFCNNRGPTPVMFKSKKGGSGSVGQ
jgi:hypothetical protein